MTPAQKVAYLKARREEELARKLANEPKKPPLPFPEAKPQRPALSGLALVIKKAIDATIALKQKLKAARDAEGRKGGKGVGKGGKNKGDLGDKTQG